MTILATPYHCRDCDWADVWRLVNAHPNRPTVYCRHTRDYAIRELRVLGYSVTDIAARIGHPGRRGCAIVRCVLDDRAWELADPGPCDLCQAWGEWQIVDVDGGRHEYCPVHASAALSRLDGVRADRRVRVRQGAR